MSKFKKIDLSKVKTYSIAERPSKVQTTALGVPHSPGNSFVQFLDSMPKILKSSDFRELVNHIIHAREHKKPVIFMMGAHVIKCGLGPIVIDLMKQDVITCVATNGAGAIHDVELTYWGETSEDVAAGLSNGTFGMARETGEIINGAVNDAKDSDLGFGEALGRRILEDAPAYKKISILAAGYELGRPVTIHVAIGTDIVHQHPSVDGAAIGEASLRDFRILTEQIRHLGHGGVALNVGSNVILPEVFLKGLTVARNLGNPVRDLITANFDIIQHYRPRMNVVKRPTQDGGKGYEFTGHHEIMIPLLAAAIKEKLG